MASYTLALPMNIACPKCGWFGNNPDSIGTHAPCDVCPVCRPMTCQVWLHPSWGQYKEYEKNIPIEYNNTVGPGSLVWVYGKRIKGRIVSEVKFAAYRVHWDDGTASIHDRKDLYRITRCTSSINKNPHNWVQDGPLDDICSECGEIAYGSVSAGGIVYPKTSCPGRHSR